MTKEEYLNIFPVSNVAVRSQDDGHTAVMDIDGYIGEDLFREWLTGEKSPNTVKNIKATLREVSADKIIVNINSYGGDLNAGIVIKDMLQSKSAEIVTNMMGFSASAATVIAQAGKTRRMPETAFMLPHRAMLGMLGFYNQNTFKSLTSDLEVIDTALISMYEKRASIGARAIADLMDEGEGYGRWVDAEEAMDKGFIDEIYDPADEDDPDTDHLESEEDDPKNRMMKKEELRKALAFHSVSGISFEEEQEESKESAAAEEARSRKTANAIFKLTHEV